MALASILAKLGRVQTDKAVLSWTEDEDLRAGYNVYVESEEGEFVPAEDGDYTTGDGKVITVVDGKVSSIVDPNAEVEASSEEPTEEAPAVVVAAMAEEDRPITRDDIDNLWRSIDRLFEYLYPLEESVKKHGGELERISDAVSRIEGAMQVLTSNVTMLSKEPQDKPLTGTAGKVLGGKFDYLKD